MGVIIFITGMAGSGKSTVGRLLADHFETCLFIQVDEVREKMVRGYARPENGEFGEEARKQFRIARAAVTCMARLYADQGISVIIDDVCVPFDFVEHYADLFDAQGIHRVLLHPRVSVLIERIEQRGGPLEHIEYVPMVHDFLESLPKDGWIVLDSSDWTAGRTVDRIISSIRHASSGPSFGIRSAE